MSSARSRNVAETKAIANAPRTVRRVESLELSKSVAALDGKMPPTGWSSVYSGNVRMTRRCSSIRRNDT